MISRKNITLGLTLIPSVFIGLYFFKNIENKPKKEPTLSNAHVAEISPVVRDKIKRLEIKCLSFNGEEKIIPINVIDVAANDVAEIFQELKKIHFPIYALSCYSPKTTANREKISLHAYAAAIDINYLMNPYYDVIERKMIPSRMKDRLEDIKTITKELDSTRVSQKETKAILNTVIQPTESDDRFLNRGILRKGMVTPKVVSIFKKHGFNIWGGNWKRPIDYMHFQIPRPLVKQLVNSNLETRRKIWETHKRRCQSDEDLSNEF